MTIRIKQEATFTDLHINLIRKCRITAGCLLVLLLLFTGCRRAEKPMTEEEFRRTREALVGANRLLVKKDNEKIRAFVQDVYTNWGTIYVLLGGDINVVPCHYKTFYAVDPDPVPNDAYYADFDSDWVCEVNIGRASVTGLGSSTGQIGNFINKIFLGSS